jgi:YD repeat-containing protein
MAAVISGNGLGLFNSSLAQLGRTHGGQAGVGQALEGQYVNIATGNLILQDQDESILTRGLPISFVRTYNSFGTVGGVGQDGWLHGFERRVTGLTGTVNTAGSTVRRVLGDGTESIFAWDAASSAYISTSGSGAHDTLTWNATNSRWTWTEGSSLQREVYDASGTNGGRLMTILDVKSGATYNLSYTSGRLTSVVSSLTNGDGLYFTYDASNRLQSINTRESGTSRGQVWFEYDGVGRLQSVLTDLAPDTVATTTTLSAKTGSNLGTGNLDDRLFRTTYAYTSASASDLRIASITQSDGTVVSYGYVSSTSQIASITRGDTNANDADGLGETLTFTYRAGETDVTDGAGRTTTYLWDAAAGNRLREVRFPADAQGVRDVAIYSYADPVDAGLVTTIETRRGASPVSRQEFEYDARGNLTREWMVLDAATGRSQRIDRTYSNTNQLLTETTYTVFDTDGRGPLNPATAEGRTVRYLYDSTTGTVSTTTNNNRVRFVIDPEGRVTEYLYQASGNGQGLVSAMRRFETTYGSTTYTTSALNTWATNAAQASRSTRTDFVYDAMGRVSEQRDFAAVNGTGAGVLDASTQITRFTYDAQGLLRQSILVRGVRDLAGGAADGSSEMTSYAYDGMGRLLGTVRKSATAGTADAETVSTTIAYQDSTRSIVTTMDSGAVQIEVRNAAGRVVSSSLQSATGVTAGQRDSAFVYDRAGQLRASRDASGAARYFFYTEDGQIAAEVDATGSVVAYAYDANGRLTGTTAYANRVTLPAWPASRDAVPAALAQVGVNGATTATAFALQPNGSLDRVSSRGYDLVGRLTAESNGEGVSVQYVYDAAGRLERRIENGAAGTADDRITRYFYDKSDRQIGVLDAEGFWTAYTYDGAGRLTKSVSHATAVLPANREATTIAALAVVATPAKDRVTRHYYNGRDQKVGELDGEGYLTVWTFDEQGNSRSERRYENRALNVLDADTMAHALAKIANPTFTETRQSYNALGQLTGTVDIQGTTTAYRYDEAGRLVGTTLASGSTLAEGGERGSVVRLNSFGEVIGEISGESLQRAIAAGQVASAEALHTAIESVKDTVFGSFGTTHAYDALSRKIETRDASGAAVWFFYDDASRLTHTLTGVAGLVGGTAGAANSQVEIVQTRYNAFGQVSGTTAYSARGQLSAANSRDAAQQIVTSLNAASNPGSAVTWWGGLGESVTNADAQATSSSATIQYDRAGRQTLLTQAISGVLSTNTQITYTAFGQVNTQTIAQGNATLSRSTTFGYDRRGVVTSTTETGGGLTRTSSVKTDAFGNAFEWTDARGVITTATHDRLGRQLTLIKPMDSSAGGATTGTSVTTYDAWGRVLTNTDANNRTTTTAYNDANRTITVTTGDGVTTTSTRNRHGETVSVTLLGGSRTHQGITTTAGAQTTVFEYDRSGRLTKTTRQGVDDQSGAQSAQNAYDIRGLLAWSTDADGRRTIYRYDAAGRQLQSILDPNAADVAGFGIAPLANLSAEPLRISGNVKVDGLGRTVEMTDGAGTVTRYEYDRTGRQTKVTVDPNGLKLQTVMEYDELGQTLFVREGDATNPNLKVTQYVYDGLGRRIEERVDPSGLNLKTVYRYDKNNNVVARVDARNNTTRFVYDADNRLRFTVDPLNGIEETRYDASGRKLESRRYTQAITLDAAQLTSLEADAPGAARDLLAGLVSALPSITESYGYDAGGQLERVTDGLGQFETYAYNAIGQRVARTDRNGNTWRYAYDAAGRLQSETDPLLQSEAYKYDRSGRLTERTDRNGNVWKTQYDAAGRVELETSPSVAVAVPQPNGAATTEQRTIATRLIYDGAGRVKSRTQDFGGSLQRTFTFEYDAAGRLYRELSPAIQVATAADDGALTVVSRSVITEYQRNANGQVTARIEDAAQPGSRTISYLYDNAGRMTRTTFPISGAVNDSGNFVATGGVDATGAFTGTPTAPFEETGYDATGRVIWVRDARGNVKSMSYDASGRLKFEVDGEGGVSEYRYDAAGQKTALVRYSSLSTSGVILDGRPPVVATTATDRVLTMEYDPAGRLRRQFETALPVFRLDGSPETAAISPETQYRYDALGQLRQEATLIESGRWAIKSHFYDALGRKTHTVDALGYVTRTQYTALGQEKEITEHARAITGWAPVLATGLVPAGSPPAAPSQGDVEIGFDRTTRLDYDALGRRTQQVSGHTHEMGAALATTATAFDALGRQTVVITNGERQELRYDAADRMVAVIDSARSVLDPASASQTGFNSIRELQTTRSPLTQYAHDAFGAVIAQRRVASGWVAGQSISSWVGASISDEDQVTRFQRDRQGRVWAEQRLAPSATDGIRRVEHAVFMRHDAVDQLVRSFESVEVAAGQIQSVVSSFTYDKAGRQTHASVSRAGSVEVSETIGHNAFGEVVRKSYAGVQGELSYQYDTAGRLTRTNADGGKWVDFGYSVGGARVREVRAVAGQPAPMITLHTADVAGNIVLTRMQDTNGAYSTAVAVRRDRWGNAIRQVVSTVGEPVDRVSEFRYNANGLKTYERRPAVRVVVTGRAPVDNASPELSWEYDSLGRLTRQVDANGYFSTFTYGAGGVLTASRDAAGVETRRAHDVFGRERMSEVFEIGAVSSSGAAIDGNLVMVRDYNHADAVTRVRSLNRPSSGANRVYRAELAITLNARGDRLSEVGVDGVSISYEYDSQRRVIGRSSAASGRVTASYDTAGNKTYEGDAFGGESSTFDAFGRLLQTTDRGGRQTNFSYDASSGLRIGEQIPSGPSKSYTYYANGLVKSISESSGSFSSYAYDAAGNRTVEQLELPAGAAGPGAEAKWQQTVSAYDALNRVSRITQIERADPSQASSAKTIFIANYAYDAAGNRTEVRHQTSMTGIQNRAPSLLQPLPDRVFRSGVNAEFKLLPSAYFRDPDGDALSVSFTITDMDGALIALPSWLTISTAVGGELTFTATNPPAGQRFKVNLTAIAATGNRAPVNASFEISTRPSQGPDRVGASLLEYRFKPGQAWTAPQFTAAEHFVEREVGDSVRRLVWTTPTSLGGIQVTASPTGPNPLALTFQGPATIGTYEFTVQAVDTEGKTSVAKTVRFIVWEDRLPEPRVPVPVITFEPGAYSTYQFALDELVTDDGQSTLSLVDITNRPSWMTYEAATVRGKPGFILTINNASAGITNGSEFSFTPLIKDGNPTPVAVPLIARARVNNAPTRLVATKDLGTTAGNARYESVWMNVADYFVDPEGDALTLVPFPTPGTGSIASFLRFERNGAQFRWVSDLTPGLPGGLEATIDLLATDASRQSLAVTFRLTVTPANRPPQTLSTPANPIPNRVFTIGQAGQSFSVAPYFTDPDGDDLDYYAGQRTGNVAEGFDSDEQAVFPPWLSYDSETGVFQFLHTQPTTPASFKIRLRVVSRDGQIIGSTTAKDWRTDFDITLQSAPVNQNPTGALSPITIATNTAFDASNGQLTGMSDPEGQTLTYSASGTWPNGIGVTSAGVLTGTFSSAYSGTLNVNVSDGVNTVVRSFTLTATAANQPPTGNINAITIVVGTAFTSSSGQLIGMSDPEGQALSYLPTGTWPNGIGVTSAGVLTGTFLSPFSGTLSVNVSDGVNTIARSFNLTATAAPVNQPPTGTLSPITVAVGTAFTVTTGQLTGVSDPEGQALSYSASGTWPNGIGVTTTGVLTGSFASPYSGTLSVNISDGVNTVVRTFGLTATAANQAPIPGAALEDIWYQQNDWVDYVFPSNALVDPEGGAITYTRIQLVTWNGSGWNWTGLIPAGLSVDPASRRVFGQVTGRGFYTFGIEGRDAQGALGMTTLRMEVIEGGGFEPLRMMSALSSPEMGMQAAAAPEGGGAVMAVVTDNSTLQAEVAETFTYDGLGRMTSRDSADAWSDVVYQYNARGQVVGETRFDEINGVREPYTVVYQVDAIGRRVAEWVERAGQPTWLRTRWSYHADNVVQGSAGQLAGMTTYFSPTATLKFFTEAGPSADTVETRSLSGFVQEATRYTYDAAGRQTLQERWTRPALTLSRRGGNSEGNAIFAYSRNSAALFLQPNAIPPNVGLVDAWVAGGLDLSAQRNENAWTTLLRRASYSETTGYDAAGRVSTYRMGSENATFGEAVSGTQLYTHSFTNSWVGGADGWVEGSVAGGSDNDNFRATTTTRGLDTWGRVAWQEQNAQSIDRQERDVYRYNADGQVVLRQSYWKQGGDWQQGDPNNAQAPKPNYRFVYSNGESLAEIREAEGGARVLVSGSAPGGSVVSRAVSAAMPQMAWQSNLEASSVAGAGGPYSAGGGRVVAQPGDTLRSLSQRAYGSSSYWYVLAEANGYSSADDTPAAGISLSAPALTVTRNDAGTFKPYNPLDALGPSTPSLPFVPPSSDGCGKVGQMLMVIVAVVVTIYTAGAASGFTGGFMATMTQGVGVLAGTATGMTAGAMMTAAAIGGAVGSVASQAVGLATGTIQNFSWRGVATSALTAGVGAGVGTAAQYFGVKGLVTAAASGLGSSVANASINGGFSWRQVAANVVGNAIGSAVGGAVGDTLGKGDMLTAGQFAAGMAGKMVGGMVSLHARRALGSDERIDYGSIAADAFANSLVDRWVGQHKQSERLAANVQLLNARTQANADEAMARVGGDVAAKADARWAVTADKLIAKTGKAIAESEIPMPDMAPLERKVAEIAAERARYSDFDAPVAALFNERFRAGYQSDEAQRANRFSAFDRRDRHVADRRAEQARLQAPNVAAMNYDRSPDRLMAGEFRRQWTDSQAVPSGDVNQLATLMGLGGNVAVSNSGKYELKTFGQNQYSHMGYVVSDGGNDHYTAVPYFQLLSYGELKAEGVWTGMEKPKMLAAGGGIVGRLTFFSGSERLGDSDWRVDYRLAQVYELTAEASAEYGTDRGRTANRFAPQATASARVSVARGSASLAGGSFDFGPLKIAGAGELQADVGSAGGIVKTNNNFYGTGWRTQGRVGGSHVVGGAVTWDIDVQLNREWFSNNNWWIKYATKGGN